MIKLDCKTAKTYIVRFYPNISTVQYPVFNKTYYWHRNAIEPKMYLKYQKNNMHI